MGRGIDPFWVHAEKVNGGLKFKCNHCQGVFSGGASRIKAHLAGVSGHDIVACDAVPPDVQNQARATQKKREAQATQGTNKKLKSASTSASKLKNKGKEEYMAEIVLNDVVDRLIANAFSLHASEYIGFESSFKVELKNLLETLFKIKFLLDDAQKRQSSDESVRIWLMKLRDVAYDADNVLDEYSYKSFWQEVQTQNLMVDQVRSFSFCNPDKVKTIKQLLDKIVHDVAGFGLRIELVNSIPNISLDMNIDPLVDDSEVVGREYDVSKMFSLPEDLSNLIKLRHIHVDTMLSNNKTPKNMRWLTCLQTLSYFCVGRDEGYQIKELGPLKNLKGKIDIKNLEMVEDEEEAKSAKLKEKEIFDLGLYWSFGRDEDEKVLEGLQPHPNLKSLTIKLYGGKKFPSWVGLSSLYHNLIEINLRDCRACEEVPTLGQLPCLRVLRIRGMGKVRCIGSEFYFYSDGSYRNTTTLFSALRELSFGEMDSLEEWKDAKELTSPGEMLVVFPCLETLCLSKCTELRYLPGVQLSVIQYLTIMGCGDELPSGLQFCTSLQYLEIVSCPNLKSIPDLGELFHSLINLKISDCSNCFDLRLKLRREGRLKTLVIGRIIKELDDFPILRYPSIRYSHASLKKLILHGSPTLNSLPNEIQLFTALEELRIQNFNGMEALPEWLSYLYSLQKLSLDYCKKLMYLPILDDNNLKHLHIDRCRNLGKRFAEGSGAEWLQIAHVPNIRIDGEYIQGEEDVDFKEYDFFGDKYDDLHDEYDDYDDSEDESISFNFDCLDGNFLEFQGFEATKFANDWKSRLKKKRDDPSEFALTGESLTVTKNLGDGVVTAIGNFCICSIAIGQVIEIIVIYGIHHRGNHVGIDKLLVLLISGIPISIPTVLYYKLTVDKSQEYDRVPSLLPPHTSSPPAYLDLYGKL
ncbi:hypothetical protein CMV_029242 [Castanea mollissima]|uniref:BED-type domain-containing protein n=1 Tax=Castanea mollissima TaxID=60419 RepID=A0A8J4Q7F7_9ROSI|nr:hypothetical protein CMV_029242 [Castanea mollissima]